MSDRLFAWHRPDGSAVDGSLSTLRESALKHVRSGHGPFHLSRDGDPLYGALTRMEIVERLTRQLRKGDVGPAFRIRDEHSEVVFVAREVKADLDVIDTNGNDHADLYWSWVKAEFSSYHPRFAGAYVCKRIAGSYTMSQHSYGNAVDVFFDSLAHQDAVFHAIIRGDCPVRVAHAISARSIWEPGTGVRYYDGDYHSHLHADFIPQFSGSCGVRAV